MELTKLPQMIAEVQRHIEIINQKEAFSQSDFNKQLINEAMADITFKFNIISTEEMNIVSGTDALNEKFLRTVHSFVDNIDQEDPEYISLQEAFRQRFKEHGFVVDNIVQFNEYSRELDDIMKKLDELSKRNKAILNKYNGDVKFARAHKRIMEENNERKARNVEPIISPFDAEVMDVLKIIKQEIDQKVYDRNDILRKDEYFDKTVMQLISEAMDKMKLNSNREDRLFIQSRISKQYLEQYKATYPDVA